jgi:hypothetical protein
MAVPCEMMRSTKSPSHRWERITRAAVGVVIAVSLVAVFFGYALGKKQRTLCWDPPSSGSAANYLVTFDVTTAPLFTTGQCIRIPTLPVGDHVAEVRAIDKDGRVGPPGSIRFVER